MMRWPIDDRGICAVLMAAGGLLLSLRLPPRAARLAWMALTAAGLANALVLSLLPENLVNINVVHHYLGAKYPFSYRSFYQLVNAALERPQVAMRDLDHPPAMVRGDPRAERAYYIDLMRQDGVEFDPLAALPELRRRAEETGAVSRESERILRQHLPEDEIAGFRRDVRLALWVEKAERNIQSAGRDITWDYGFNGSPLYALVRRLDPTLHRPFGRGTAVLNLAGQIAGTLLMVWIAGAALGLGTDGRLAMAALLFASWDFVGWALPGLVFAEVWLPLAVALLAMARRRAAIAGAAIAWAGLIKLFPFILVLPALAELAATWWRRERREVAGPESLWFSRFLVSCVLGVGALGSLALLSGRSWVDFLTKIAGQFQSEGYLLNSVSLSQGLLALGIHGSPVPDVLALAALATLAAIFLHAARRDRDTMASLPRRSLVLLAATGWLVKTWFNYYAIAPLLLLPLVAREHRRAAAAGAAGMAAAFLLPEFEDPALLGNPALHALKLAPYVLLPAWLVALEFRELGPGRKATRLAAIAIALGVAATAGEGLRLRTVRRLDRIAGEALDRGEARSALAGYRRAVWLAPLDADVRMNEAIALAHLDREREAEAGFARAAALAPRSSFTRQNNGLWLLRAGRLEEAEREIQAARALAPDDETILCDLARLRLRQGRKAEAIALLTRARELAPANAAVDSLLGQAGR